MIILAWIILILNSIAVVVSIIETITSIKASERLLNTFSAIFQLLIIALAIYVIRL